MTLQEIIKQHPAPWRHVVFPAGQVVVQDAAGIQVQLFTMLEFIGHVTASLAGATAQTAAQPTPEATPEPA